jgi:hypothetical protein
MQIKQLRKRFWQTIRVETATRPANWRRPPLHLEQLEDRTVPTLLFSSSGIRTVAYLGGPVIQNADVDLIFWGAGWTSGQGPTLQAKVKQAVATLLASPLLSGLSQYRGIGNAQLLRTDLITSTSPAAQSTDADFDAFVQANLNDGTLPITPEMDSQILYMVIPQLGTTDPAEGAAGAHDSDVSDFGRFHYGWTANADGDLDAITSDFSHELMEGVTDPEVNVNTAFVVPSTLDEIGDGEAQDYTYRLDGVLVQSFLSQQDQAYAIYDGNAQQFLVSYNRILTINSGQLTDPDDTITVGGNSAGGYLVTLNGENVQFDPAWIKEIVINTGNGNETINVEKTFNSGPVIINLGSGTNAINLSPMAQNLDHLAGALTINGGAGTNTLVVNDQGMASNETYTLTSSTLVRSGAGKITYNEIANLVLNTTNGTNTITVQSSAAGSTVTLSGGSGTNTLVGSNTANIWNLAGSNAGALGGVAIAGPVNFSGIENLKGGSANDTFVFEDGAAVTGTIDGGGGVNTLDYAPDSTSVLVNLQTSVATGVGSGIANIQNVTGGSGGGPSIYNILIGNGGNVLTGGSGRRNLLIAGVSASTLLGGDEDDILIAGTTIYDTEAGNVSLVALMTYWSSTTDDYATRVANVMTSNAVPLLDATTVAGNGGGNTMLGNGGFNLWYGNLTLDSYPDYDPTTEVFISV